MKYVVHFLCYYISYSYLTDGLFQYYKKFKSPRRNNFLDVQNNAKEIETPDLIKKVNSPSNGNVNLKDLAKYIMRRQNNDENITDSSTGEKFDFQDEYKKQWAHMQYQVLNTSIPGGDQVFMLAARPWGVPCGDPNQHDVPWGSCMLPMECDPEYRVYRGDYFCGRTDFICCGLLDNVYDLNAPFDVSFATDSFKIDSDEMRNNGEKQSYAEKKKEATDAERKKRKEARDERKKAMKDLIEKIVKEIRDFMNKAHANSSKLKRRKTKQLKLFLKYLKNQYKKDRQSVMDIHTVHSIRIDVALRNKLNELSRLNVNFLNNETFRKIIANGAQTMERSEAMMLMQAYPELQEYLIKRRNQIGNHGKKDPLNYDVEYGLMYY